MISIVRSYGSFPEEEFGVQLGANWVIPDTSQWVTIPGWVLRAPAATELTIVSGGFVVPADGEAYAAARVAFGTSTSFGRDIRILHNTTSVASADAEDVSTVTLTSATKLALAAGDTITLQASAEFGSESWRTISSGSGTWLVLRPNP